MDETIWSLTLPRVKRISGSKNFRSPPQKDFCNKIGAERAFGEAPVLASGEPCRYTLRSFINSNREGQRYSWMNAFSDWRHGGIMFEQSVQSNDLEIRVFLKVEGVASAAFRDPRIRDTTSGKHAKETGRPRSPNKVRGTLVLNLPETAISGRDPTYYLQFPFATRRICKTWAGLSIKAQIKSSDQSERPADAPGRVLHLT